MKKIVFAVLMFLPIAANAYDIEVDGIYYNVLSASGRTLEVVNGTNRYPDDLIVPEEVIYEGNTFNVTTIGEAIQDVHSIRLPQSIINVKQHYSQWGSLKKVIVDDMDTWFKIKYGTGNNGWWAARNKYDLFIGDEKITNVNTPDWLSAIEPYTFLGCSSIESVNISNFTENIYQSAFNGCDHLVEVQIGNSVQYIGERAFYECKNLAKVVIPNNVTRIAWHSFESCESLKEVSLGKSLSQIDTESFAGCTNITKITSCIEVPFFINDNCFAGIVKLKAELSVPNGSKTKYMSTEGWKDFINIVERDNDETTESQKCATPTIGYANGKLTFACDTEGAECIAAISDEDIKTHYGNEISLTATYTIKVYATAAGYDNSDIVTATLCWIDAEPNAEGIENGIAQARANAVIIQSSNGMLSISGVEDGTDVGVYSVSGQIICSAKAIGKQAVLNTNLRRGEFAIIKIGKKSVKVLMQ